MSRELEVFKDRVAPYSKFKVYELDKDVLIKHDLTKYMAQYSPNVKYFYSKNLVEDVKSYCKVHDIDLDIYLWYYTVPATDDMITNGAWNIMINSESIYNIPMYKYDTIPNRFGVNPIIYKRKTNDIAEYVYTDELLNVPLLLDRDLDNLNEIIFNEITVLDIDTGEPIEDDYYAKRKFICVKDILNMFPNVPIRKGIDSYSEILPNLYDDDTSDDKLFIEDNIFDKKDVPKYLPKYKLAIIHDQLYVFFILDATSPEDDNNINLSIVKPNNDFDKAKMVKSYGEVIPLYKNVFYNGLYINYINDNDNIHHTNNTTGGTTINLNNDYMVINSNGTNISIYDALTEILESELLKFVDESLYAEYSKIYTGLLDVNNPNYYDFKVDLNIIFFKYFIPKYILCKNTDNSVIDYELFNLSSLTTDNKLIYVYDSFITNKEDIFDIFFKEVHKLIINKYDDYRVLSIDDTTDNVVNGASEVSDRVFYRDKITQFNKLTKGKLGHKLKEHDITIDVVPNDWTKYNQDELVDWMWRNDHDMFVMFDKILSQLVFRINPKDITYVDTTKDGLNHTKFTLIDADDQKFLKFTVPNYSRRPFDLYIGNLLYDGKINIERTDKHDLVYISLLNLLTWMQDRIGDLHDVIDNADVVIPNLKNKEELYTKLLEYSSITSDIIKEDN